MEPKKKPNVDFAVIDEKLLDGEIPGFFAIFTEEEAVAAGAFVDDAIDQRGAVVASFDNPDL